MFAVPAESNPLLSFINFMGGGEGGEEKQTEMMTEGLGGSWAGAISLCPASQEIRSGTDYFCPSFVGHL